MLKKIIFVIFYLLSLIAIHSQEDTNLTKNYGQRKVILTSSSGVLTIGSLVTLNQAWYASYNTGKFHFFNDSKEWLQVDKIGHAYSNYQIARIMISAFDWAGYSKKKQLIYGGSMGFVYMTAIECMDGFSKGWGFSWGDELCNFLGTGLAISQHAFWNEQKIEIKFSYSKSGLAKYNPSLLGKNSNEQILKDYNGQKYWLSFNPFYILNKQTKFPHWLHFALGYGAGGMIGGTENKIIPVDNFGNIIKLERQRKYFLSLDINLRKIQVKNKIIKSVFNFVSVLKFPLPALELNNKGLKFHYICY